MTTALSGDPGDDDTHIPGEAGMWVLIFAEMSIFAICFVLYLHERSQDVAAFRAAQHSLNLSFGALNTMLLLTSSLLVYVGLQAVRRRLHNLAPRLFAAALVCAVAFCVVKVFEWRAKISDGWVPSTNDFYAYYFAITGLHLFHVLFGIGLLAFLLVQSRRPEPSDTRMMFMEGGAVWWHMVDLNWMILFPLLYLAR